MRRLDLTGHTYGDWTVLSYAGKQANGTLWLCRCTCGTERAVLLGNLRSGKSTGCGCTRKDKITGRPRIDEPGYYGSHTRIYRTRGPARDHTCSWPGCTQQADEWAYDYADPNEHTGPVFDNRDGKTRPLRWSGDPQHYHPLCHGHHTAHDRHMARQAS